MPPLEAACGGGRGAVLLAFLAVLLSGDAKLPPGLYHSPHIRAPAAPLLVRGGSAATNSASATTSSSSETVKVTVLTIAGSPHLDLKTRLDVPLSANVSTLKSLVHERMAGHPPAAVQRLVFGTRVLADGEILSSIVAPPERDEFDEFDGDEEDEEDEEDAATSGPKQLSLVLDILPPLPVEKSLPAALEAKLKAYAAELVAVRHLTNELVGGVLSGKKGKAGGDRGVGVGVGAEAEEEEEEEGVEEGDDVMRTEGLKGQIRAVEEHILHLVERNITLRKTTIHSAVAEDGRVPNLVWRDGGAGGGAELLDELNGGGGESVGPWRQFQRTAKHHADVDWKNTLRNMVTCFFVAKFGAHGPTEEAIIHCAAVGLVAWQMRPVRLGLKIGFALASEFRGGPLVDLFSTLLPTSHQALLEAEDVASRFFPEGDDEDPFETLRR
jgi:hypothetical protein